MTVVPIAELAGDYLSVLEELAVEIDEAMSALAHNSCSDFRERVARQESLCSEMTYLARGLLARVESPAIPAIHHLDPQLAARIQAAHQHLQSLNRCYAILLANSSRSVEALSALCRTCLEQFQFATTDLPQQKTWSCEV